MEKLITKSERNEAIDYCFDTDWPNMPELSNSDFIKIRDTFGFQMWKLDKEFRKLINAIKKEFYGIFGK